MQFTEQQEYLFDQVRNNTTNLSSKSVPGGGKSTTMRECLKGTKTSSRLVMAFSNVIKDEATKLLRDARISAEVSTFHGWGRRSLTNAYPGIALNNDKYKAILLKRYPKYGFTHKKNGNVILNAEGGIVEELIAKCRMYMVDKSNSYNKFKYVMKRFGLHPPNLDEGTIYEQVLNCMEDGRKQTTFMDFTDMIWMPVVNNLSIGTLNFTAIDEYQDMAPMSRAFTDKMLQRGTRLLVVGDPKQSIFGFAGADENACEEMDTLLESSANRLTDCPLTVTFRCPQSHSALAAKLVPQIQSCKGAIQGGVHFLESEQYDVFRKLKGGDLIISRKNSNLLKLAYSLIKERLPFIIRGKDDFAKSMMRFIDKFKTDSITELEAKVKTYFQKEMLKLMADPEFTDQSQIVSLEDKVDCVFALCEAGFENVPEMKKWMVDTFSDAIDKSKLILTTAHRAKGLESENGVIIKPGEFPLIFACYECRNRLDSLIDNADAKCPFCKGTRYKSSRWEVNQELNLLFVAITRFKNNMYFMGELPTVLKGGNLDWGNYLKKFAD